MTNFIYQIINKNNVVERGNITAINKNEAIKILKNKGYLIVKIKKQNIFTKEIVFNKNLSSRDLSFFCRHLYFYINAGINLSNLNINATNKKLKNEFEHLRESILKGESISGFLIKNSYPQLLCSMVKIGEESGMLPHILEKMEVHYERETATHREIIALLTYPLIVIIAMVIVIAITMIYLVPNFTQMFNAQNIELPQITLILIAISNFFTSIFALIPVIIITILVYFIKTRKLDSLIFKIPIFNKLIKLIVATRFSNSMAIMINSGISIYQAINITEGLLKNKQYKLIIKNIKSDLQKGISLSATMERSLYFHPILLDMTKLGENTGTLAETLNKCSNFFEKEQQLFISYLKKQLEPTLTIIMGVLLLFIMLAIMLPTFAITGSI